MITRFITEVSTVFNPFSPKAKTARLFLSVLPPNARQTMKIDTKILPRASKEPSLVRLKFSMFRRILILFAFADSNLNLQRTEKR